MNATNAVPMILAAGLATRLRPLTERQAKAAVPFLNRPLLDYSFDWLARCGFDRAVVNLHHRPDSIVDLYGGRAFGIDIVYSHEPALLGTAGGPRAALEHLGERALLMNGDVVGAPSLGPLLRHHEAVGALATLALHCGPAGASYPQVVAQEDGRLLAFPGDADPSATDGVRGVFSGTHLVERAVLEDLPVGVPCGIVDPVYRELLASGLRIDALPVPGPWYEVGTPSLYIDQQLEALRRESLPLAFEGLVREGGGAYSSPHAHVENARPRPPYLLGAGCRLKQGSFVEACVLGDRSQVGAGASLRRCILWQEALVGNGCRLDRCIVMRGVAVPAATQASDTAFTSSGPISFARARAGTAS